MIDKTRKDRDWIWGRVFGELSLWQDRARSLTPAQRGHFLANWQTQPTLAFVTWMERYMMTVVEAGAEPGDEDRRIGEILWDMTPEMMGDTSPLGGDAWLAYYQERGEYRTARQQVMSDMGRVKTEKKAAASRENGKKGGRPRKVKPSPNA